jgi:hypothetical protein
MVALASSIASPSLLPVSGCRRGMFGIRVTGYHSKSRPERYFFTRIPNIPLDREASTSPLTKGNKKAQSHHTPIALGYG